MTTIAFQLGQLSPLEARALSAMLAVVAGEPAAPIAPVKCPAVPAAPLSTDFKVEPIPGTSDFNVISITESNETTVAPEVAVVQKPTQEAPKAEAATLAPGEPKDSSKPCRTRRTKAEMEAARAAEKVQEAPVATGPVAPSAKSDTASAEPKAPTLNELREALQSYVARHNMDQGLGLLKEFGPDDDPCTRITHLQDLPVADQMDFIKLATNA